MSEAKPFCISKKEVWEAYKRVKANKGAAGVDDQSIEDFEKKLKKNLYKIWNRMSSGSYFPPPVRTVKIPKKNGGERKLGIPTVADRIAQQVVKARLEPEVEPLFHADSYGYRPGKSALDAVGQARERCWRYDWVLDLDIRSFFDSLSQDLLLRAVKKHAQERWIVLYIERWLKAPVQEEDGRLVPREKGTPQGGVASPLLANLFLHYALARIIHIFEDNKGLLCYKHVVKTMFAATKEASECLKIAQHSVCCSQEFFTSRSWPSLISGKGVPTAGPCC
jgi:RNA-directed DNA polymerase